MPVAVDIHRTDVIVAVDPGRRCGVAIFRRGMLAECRAVNGCQEMAEATLGNLGASAALVIERQHQRQGKRQNPKAVETLMERRLEWEFVAKQHRIPIVRIYASQWQAGTLPKVRGMDTKQRARMFCLASGYAANTWTEDQCDAVAIGAWYLGRVRWALVTSTG